MSSRQRKSSEDSIDSRSHSFDSTERIHITHKSTTITSLTTKRRKREQSI